MKIPAMKIQARTASGIAAMLCWVLLSALLTFILWGARDRARLIRDNDNERLFNVLFFSLRDYDDIGAAIEANPVLRERLTGFAVYGNDLLPRYSWGKTPPVFNEAELEDRRVLRNGRFIIPSPRDRTVRFVLRFDRLPPPPETPPGRPRPPPVREVRRQERSPAGSAPPFIRLDSRISGKYVYIDIFHPAYWSTMALTTALLPLGSLGLLFLVLYIRGLYVRNAEYRERIEAQKNLVVLGTAASTLAHEIKNPLLSIRLQTGILGKLFPGAGKEEVGIINEEVDRLSALIYRVNDYLREPVGNPRPINAYDLVEEISRRLCGRSILLPESWRGGFFLMDPGRARSVFENIIRNALESGGSEDDLGALVSRGGSGGRAGVEIALFDRGKGIAPEDKNRIFDPFFTTKSAGTGIGLSVSKRFVEAAGGTIVPESREGGGTLIRLSFPGAAGAENSPREDYAGLNR